MPEPSGFPQLAFGFALLAISTTPGWLQALISAVADSIADFNAAVRLIPVLPQRHVTYRVTAMARVGFIVAALCMIALGILAMLS